MRRIMSKFVDDEKAGLDRLLDRSLICDGRVVNTKEWPEHQGFFSAACELYGGGGNKDADYKDAWVPNITGSITGHDFEVYHPTMRAKMLKIILKLLKFVFLKK